MCIIILFFDKQQMHYSDVLITHFKLCHISELSLFVIDCLVSYSSETTVLMNSSNP